MKSLVKDNSDKNPLSPVNYRSRFSQHRVNMPEYLFSLTRIFSYKDRIYDSVLMWENKGQRKPVLWHILRSASLIEQKILENLTNFCCLRYRDLLMTISIQPKFGVSKHWERKVIYILILLRKNKKSKNLLPFRRWFWFYFFNFGKSYEFFRKMWVQCV